MTSILSIVFKVYFQQNRKYLIALGTDLFPQKYQVGNWHLSKVIIS